MGSYSPRGNSADGRASRTRVSRGTAPDGTAAVPNNPDRRWLVYRKSDGSSLRMERVDALEAIATGEYLSEADYLAARGGGET